MRQLVYEKENAEFKPVKPRLKIDVVSYPARAEGLGKYGQGDISCLDVRKSRSLYVHIRIFCAFVFCFVFVFVFCWFFFLAPHSIE